MRPGQTQFPYVLISENPDAALAASKFALDGVQSDIGVHTFRSESDFETIFDSIRSSTNDFALVQAENSNYAGDGRFSRVFGHIG